MEVITPNLDLTGIGGVLINALLALMAIPLVRYAVPPVTNVLKRVIPVNPAVIAGILTVIIWGVYTVYAALGQEQQLTSFVELLVPLLIAIGGADLSAQEARKRYEAAKESGAPGYTSASAYKRRLEARTNPPTEPVTFPDSPGLG